MSMRKRKIEDDKKMSRFSERQGDINDGAKKTKKFVSDEDDLFWWEKINPNDLHSVEEVEFVMDAMEKFMAMVNDMTHKERETENKSGFQFGDYKDFSGNETEDDDADDDDFSHVAFGSKSSADFK